jgi:hypothetical protein
MINNERFWNGLRCVEALDYGQMCTNPSSNNECQYLTQGTSCIGPAPFKCQCSNLQYFDIISGKCQYQFNVTLSNKTISSSTSIFIPTD